MCIRDRDEGRKGEGREGTKEGRQRGEVEGLRGNFLVNEFVHCVGFHLNNC